ncbi:MAG: hypothetical protein ABFS12_02275 [Bacteroidota bacterium]
MKQIICFFIIVIFSFLLLTCSDDGITEISDQDDIYKDYLQIQTAKSQYSHSEDFHNSYAHISGTVTNTTQDTFYSKLGDAFNSSIDQDVFLIANKTDGFYEFKNSSNNWASVEQGHLIEGSKVIRILPETQYTVQATAIIDSNQTGNFRLRIQYYRNYDEAIVDTLQDISNVFTIKK